VNRNTDVHSSSRYENELHVGTSVYSSALRMEAARSSQIVVLIYRIIRHHFGSSESGLISKSCTCRLLGVLREFPVIL
jgi:hypothetical protein